MWHYIMKIVSLFGYGHSSLAAGGNEQAMETSLQELLRENELDNVEEIFICSQVLGYFSFWVPNPANQHLIQLFRK